MHDTPSILKLLSCVKTASKKSAGYSDTSPTNLNHYITNVYAKLAQTITWPIQLNECEYFK